MNDAFASDCLSDRLVLISGGLGSLGQTIVPAFQEKGGTVAVADLSEPSDVDEDLHTGDLYVQCDVSEEEDVERAFEQVHEQLDRYPDTVLAHAGINQEIPLEDYSESDWEEIFDVNVKGSFLFARTAIRRMKGKRTADHPGKVIFTTSWVKDVPWPEISGYNSTKSAIDQFMRSAAREHAEDHILFNAVAPGIVDAGMARKQYQNNPEYRERADRAIPLGRLQPPETVADAFLFLASSASNYMTGQTITVDGGASLYPMI